MMNDLKDRHVLAAAVYGRCDVIVTENTQDFPLESTDPYKIRCLLQTNFVRSIPVWLNWVYEGCSRHARKSLQPSKNYRGASWYQ